MERIEEAEVLESQPGAYRRKLSLESPQRRLSPQPPYRGSSPSRPGRQRKMSFPSSSPSLSSYQLSLHELPDAAKRYRRFSNVSDAVSRKLSTTLGWRTVSVQEVVTQAKSLCGQHNLTVLSRGRVD